MKSSNVMLESPSVAFSSLLLPSSQALNLTVSFHKCSGRLFLSHPQGLVFGPDPCRGLTVLHPQVHPSLSQVDILKQTRSSHCPEETSPCPSLYDGLYTRQVVTSVTAPHSPHTLTSDTLTPHTPYTICYTHHTHLHHTHTPYTPCALHTHSHHTHTPSHSPPFPRDAVVGGKPRLPHAHVEEVAHDREHWGWSQKRILLTGQSLFSL